jgi:hypothetical protein
MHCKMTCILYKKQAHFSQLFCLQVRSVTPWQSHDRKSRCLRGRRLDVHVVWFVDGQNHEILKPAISRCYIRFHSVYRPWFYIIRKHLCLLLSAGTTCTADVLHSYLVFSIYLAKKKQIYIQVLIILGNFVKDTLHSHTL